MAARPQNLLFILSDEHNAAAMGCAGHPFVRTPNLDALAARGTRFTAAITPSPICVPARAALATGRPVSRMDRFWDNGDAYDGTVPSWHHALRDGGHRVVSIGKLHFRGLPGDDHGFSEERLAMHVVEGKGDLLGQIRGPEAPERKGAAKMARGAGPGESDYTRYDRDIAAQAQIWLRDEAARHADRPWCLFVSLVTPHFPLVAPPEHFYAYRDLPPPKLYDPAERPDHPSLRDYNGTNAYGKHVRDAADLQRMMAGYYGLVSFMDEQVGKILRCLADCGLGGTTRVLYSSDHGDNVGARGLWGKSNMYAESVAVPMILAGEGVPPGATCGTAVSLTDAFATVVDAVGAPAGTVPPASRSLLALAAAPDDPDRAVLSEYHATGSREASFMVRDGRWKHVRWITYPPMLFDLDADPEELNDLGGSTEHAAERAQLEARLRDLLDGRTPEAVDASAKARQRANLEAHGGAAAALARGEIPFSPPPGVRPDWS